MPTKLTKDFVDEMLNMGERAIPTCRAPRSKAKPSDCIIVGKETPSDGFSRTLTLTRPRL